MSSSVVPGKFEPEGLVEPEGCCDGCCDGCCEGSCEGSCEPDGSVEGEGSTLSPIFTDSVWVEIDIGSVRSAFPPDILANWIDAVFALVLSLTLKFNSQIAVSVFTASGQSTSRILVSGLYNAAQSFKPLTSDFVSSNTSSLNLNVPS